MHTIFSVLKNWSSYRGARICIVVFFLVLGAVLRMFFLSHDGAFSDLQLISSWGRIISLYGWTDVYRHRIGTFAYANYPPGNLAIIGTVVRIHDALGGSLQVGGSFMNTLMKLPTCIADAWLSFMIFAVVRRFSSVRHAVTAGLLYWLNPGVWLLSAVWGQTDGIYTALSFAGLIATIFGFPFLAGLIIALSLFVKIQSVILFPVSVLLLLRRPKDIAPFIAGAFPVLLLFLPFIFADRFIDIVNVYTKAPGLPPFVTFNAFNFWWGIFSGSSPFIPDFYLIAGKVSYRTIGYVITCVGYVIILHRLYQSLSSTSDIRKRTHVALAAAVLCNLVFFFFMTRMQQRYTMVFFPCAITLGLLVPYGRKHLTFLMVSFIINTTFVMYSYYRFDVWALPSGQSMIGFLLAWANLFIAADLAALWWKTILKPSRSTKT